MDENVKAILKQLAGASNQGLQDSEDLAASVRKLEGLGYEFSLYLEATILLTRDGEEAPASPKPRSHAATRRRIRSGSLSLSEKDLKFLKSLKIAIHTGDAAKDGK